MKPDKASMMSMGILQNDSFSLTKSKQLTCAPSYSLRWRSAGKTLNLTEKEFLDLCDITFRMLDWIHDEMEKKRKESEEDSKEGEPNEAQ